MKELDIENPFKAPVYFKETVSSTMEESRALAGQGKSHGTVIAADFQEQGRGRKGRPWQAGRGQALFFTILLRYIDFAAVPKAITLKTGLALSLALEDFAPPLKTHVELKWPNDVMIFSKKAAGILSESGGGTVYIGIGVNTLQTEFPEQIKNKAVSILLALDQAEENARRENTAFTRQALTPASRFVLLGHILARLYAELEQGKTETETPLQGWRARLESRLFMKDKTVRFFPGPADSGAAALEGVLKGIGSEGELILLPRGVEKPEPFVTGELAVYI
jgi:BirA family biotin operon repressor/biotin-[acetyl-CoA-carboxylase] ligase